MTILKFKKLHPAATAPVYATAGAACFDLHACTVDEGTPDNVAGTLTVGTGLAVEVPEGWAMLVYSRSGHGFRHNVRLANCVGVIDSDYRGEVMVKLTHDDLGSPLTVRTGDRIAQAMLVPVYRTELVEADDLSKTMRGTGGLGSTGA